MEAVHVLHPFEPVFDSRSAVLILGSFPSVKSREQRFYYGHPRNRFWPLLGTVFGESVPAETEEKKAFLLRHRLALWDVITECDIIGSSDASIRNARPAEIGSLLEKSAVQTILCNGSLSGKLYARYLEPVTGIPAVVLPSTSPANAAWSPERLVSAWRPFLTAL